MAHAGTTIRVTQTKSTNGRLDRHKACVAGLGLRRIGHTVEVPDTPASRGGTGVSDTMRLNTLRPAPGSRRAARRVGRGIGSGMGKTAGRGHKGQKSRSGGTVAPGFEGGQMPLQKRLPKYGFTSRIARTTAQVRLGELNKVTGNVIDLQALKDADVIRDDVRRVRVFLSGELGRAVTLKGIAASKGAREAIERAGGSVQE